MSNETGPKFFTSDILSRVAIKDVISNFANLLSDENFIYKNPNRVSIENSQGHLLVMPAEIGDFAGIKIAAVVPDNPAKGFPRIQATYILQELDSMQPIAFFDGNTLTLMRTSALSAAVLNRVQPKDSISLGIFGVGPQAIAHIKAIKSIRDIRKLFIFIRRDKLDSDFQQVVNDLKIDCQVVNLSDLATLSSIIPALDVIVTATSSKLPLFKSELIGNSTFVIAIGSHQLDYSEIDTEFFKRARVLVENVDVAMRESGEIAQAIDSGTLDPKKLITIHELFRLPEESLTLQEPTLYKSVGMAWQDLAIAKSIYTSATL